jgi:hypothetical protein
MAQAARGGLLLYQRRLGGGAFEYHCYRPVPAGEPSCSKRSILSGRR